jgi:hypothetical protein
MMCARCPYYVMMRQTSATDSFEAVHFGLTFCTRHCVALEMQFVVTEDVARYFIPVKESGK